MGLKSTYISKDLKELIKIIENAPDYSIECIETIIEIILERNISSKEVNSIAIEVNNEIIYNKIKKMNLSSDFIPHKSVFLTEETLTEMYKSAIKKYIKDKKNIDYNEKY